MSTCRVTMFTQSFNVSSMLKALSVTRTQRVCPVLHVYSKPSTLYSFLPDFPIFLFPGFFLLPAMYILTMPISMYIPTSDYSSSHQSGWSGEVLPFQKFSLMTIFQEWVFHAVTVTFNLYPHSKPHHNCEPNLGYFPLCQLVVRNAHVDTGTAHCW